MSSQINFTSINANFPIAGQDNNSQGFRDNFTAISTALATAKAELSALQSNTILSRDLATSSAEVSNNLLGSTILNGAYSQFNGVVYNIGVQASSSPVSIDLDNGPVQLVTLSGDNTLTFTNWSASNFSAVRVVATSSQGYVSNITFSSENGGNLVYDVDFPSNVKVGGENVYRITVAYPGRNFVVPTDVIFTGGDAGTTIGATAAQAVADYKLVTASTFVNKGNGYTVGDLITMAGSNVIMQVATLSLSFTANTTINSATLSNVSSFTNLAAGVVIHGTNIPANTTVVSINVGAGTLVMSAPATNTQVAVPCTYVSTTGPISTVSFVYAGQFVAPLTAPAYNITSITGTGSGATIAPSFGVNSVTVTNTNHGYISVAPSISFDGGDSLNPATAEALLTGQVDPDTQAAIPPHALNAKVFDAWTTDGGTNIYVRYVGEFQITA